LLQLCISIICIFCYYVYLLFLYYVCEGVVMVEPPAQLNEQSDDLDIGKEGSRHW
jgi:hypothetical protein